MSTPDLESTVRSIQERNARVELDKAWETSLMRRGSICAITYAVALAWLFVTHEPYLFLKAVVPVLGYMLSTLSLPVIKERWARSR